MKKLLIGILVLVMLFSVAACGNSAVTTEQAPVQQGEVSPETAVAPEENTTHAVGFTISDLSNPTWAAMTDVIESECEARGWTFTAIQHDGDGAKIIQTVENFISTGCDFIVLETGMEEAVADVLQQAKDAGCCIVAAGTPLQIADINLLNDNYDAGYLSGVALGKWFNEVYGEDHEALIAQMVFDYDIITDRTNGQLDGLASVHPNYRVVATGYPEDAATAMTETENILTAHPEIEAITHWGDSMALGSLETARAMGYTADNFALVSIDGTKEACAEIKAGSSLIASTSMGTPEGQGQFIFDVLLNYTNGIFEETSLLPNTLVDASNVDEYLK